MSSNYPPPAEKLLIGLRQGQIELAQWQKGMMAVSAVPGAGKSHSLAMATTLKIIEHNLNYNRYLLVVTYTRSAVASIKQKIEENLTNLNLPLMGFSVQTIHGLALNIASRYGELSQLHLDVNNLVDITSTHPLIRETVDRWMSENETNLRLLIQGKSSESLAESDILLRQSILRAEILPSLARNLIRIAKSSRWQVSDLKSLHHFDSSFPYPLSAIASGLYEQYEKIKQKSNLLDYEDLILGALKVLDYETPRQTLQAEIFGVFEDEAQDSSPLQGDLLTILAKENDHSEPNLVRVGDPNQAINSTFTSSDPFYFNQFCLECQQKNKLYSMPQAGRSSPIIIKYANKTLQWIETELNKENRNLRENTPVNYQAIEVVGKNDPQTDSNPPPEGKGVEIYQPQDIYETTELITTRIMTLLEKNPLNNVGILVRLNKQGNFIFEQINESLSKYQIPVKLINNKTSYLEICQEILSIVRFLETPHSPECVRNALITLHQKGMIKAMDFQGLSLYPEQLLYPTKLDKKLNHEEEEARAKCTKLLKAKIELSSYQIIPFLSSELKYQNSALATVQKLSETVERQIRGKSSFNSLVHILEKIVNEDKFEGIDEETEDMYTQAGQVTIMTMHKSKGLQWDYVFLPFLHDSVLPGSNFVTQNQEFIGNYNLTDVVRQQLRTAIHYKRQHQSIEGLSPTTLELAWNQANYEKKAEEYRLLYVAMTRAKKLLWMSAAKKTVEWNFFNGENDQNSLKDDKKPCPVLEFLLNNT